MRVPRANAAVSVAEVLRLYFEVKTLSNISGDAARLRAADPAPRRDALCNAIE
jgi:hypothetical protein